MRTESLTREPKLSSLHPRPDTTALKAILCAETLEPCVGQYGPRLRALVLTGSLARDEATFIPKEHSVSLLGDAEFLLVFHQDASLPPTPALTGLSRRIAARLCESGLACRITLSAVKPSYLERLPPHIFGYELCTCGKVIWGDSHILHLIPAFSPGDIPLEDAWRLLCNRMIEHLELAGQAADSAAPWSAQIEYQTVKLYLDMATSFLLFAGAYEPTYRQRAERLSRLAANSLPREAAPFPLSEFATRVAACTEWKLQGAAAVTPFPVNQEKKAALVLWRETVSYVHRVWQWELARLTGSSTPIWDRELLAQWMRGQALRDRLRGWLYALRHQRWHHSWRHWPRWARRCWLASPRYWIYAAASEVFFRLPELLAQSNPRPARRTEWDELYSWLPVVRGPALEESVSPWRRLAAEIAWNYQQFLVDTRA